MNEYSADRLYRYLEENYNLDRGFAVQMIVNLVDYGIREKDYHKGQLADFLGEILPVDDPDEIREYCETPS